MIAIVDYGLGNLRAFLNVYRRLNIPAEAASRADALSRASKILLPGVGAFDDAMQKLDASGLREALEDLVVRRGVPVLGVCVGMQMLMEASDEGRCPGLGWVPGGVRRLDTLTSDGGWPVPHMGWNDVHPRPNSPLFAGLPDDARFYFLHSYYVEPARAEHVLATATYGADFACAVQSGHVFGVQFHPEKSHHDGVRLLRNFAEM